DRMAVPAHVSVFGTDESWPLALVRLLGYYLAAGALSQQTSPFTHTDPEIIEDCSAILAEHFPLCEARLQREDSVCCTIVAYRHAKQIPRHGNPLWEWLSSLGLRGMVARTKAFPSCVWTWSRRYLAEFIRALMSCDGTLCLHGGSDYPCIAFDAASRQLATDMQHALTRFGIASRRYENACGSWHVEVTDPEAVQCYGEQIGWIGKQATRIAKLAPGVCQALPADTTDMGAHHHPSTHGSRLQGPQASYAAVREVCHTQGLARLRSPILW